MKRLTFLISLIFILGCTSLNSTLTSEEILDKIDKIEKIEGKGR